MQDRDADLAVGIDYIQIDVSARTVSIMAVVCVAPLDKERGEGGGTHYSDDKAAARTSSSAACEDTPGGRRDGHERIHLATQHD